jgi:chemotaxis protein methyltransferase CheR
MTPGEISVLADLARRRSGVVIDADKTYILESRLAPVARRQGFVSLSELVADLQQRQDEALIWATVEALASTETQFFRDRIPFQQIAAEVLPALARKGRQTVSAWCAGCATGQEPYSLAILAEEERGRHGPMGVEILATELSERSLEKAVAGVYTQFEVQRGLGVMQMIRCFEECPGATWRISPELQRAVQFHVHSLAEPPPHPGEFDIILCRNVLLYFSVEMRRRVFDRLAEASHADTVLMLGAGETVIGQTGQFVSDPDCRGLYIRPVPSRPGMRAAS